MASGGDAGVWELGLLTRLGCDGSSVLHIENAFVVCFPIRLIQQCNRHHVWCLGIPLGKGRIKLQQAAREGGKTTACTETRVPPIVSVEIKQVVH